MKHLIETTDLSNLPIAEYDRLILDSSTNEIAYRGGVKYEVVPYLYIYNETDNKYYQKIVGYGKTIKTNATVDLNSQWVSDSEDNEYRYFKSNSNVGIKSSYSQCKVTWSNLTSITFKYMSSSQIYEDYLCVGILDGEKFTVRPSYRRSNVYLSTYGKTSGKYYEFTIECDEGEHHIWFCYQKNSGGNSGEDRGFIGVPKYALSIVDIKQGSELPMKREYGGISVEDDKKAYDIYVNNVTVPNGNIVGDYKNVEKTEKTINTEYVDLGLPSGLKWAKCNIGATTETDYGIYFQWGETSGESGILVGKYSDEKHTIESYKYYNGTYTKYTATDSKTTLDPEDDAATQIMGSEWRMPTKGEFNELLNNTTNEWIRDFNDSRVKGWKFTSKTDTSKYIFIPASGFYYDGSLDQVGEYGRAWASSFVPANHSYADYLMFGSGNDGCHVYSNKRYDGLPVRGVRK